MSRMPALPDRIEVVAICKKTLRDFNIDDIFGPYGTNADSGSDLAMEKSSRASEGYMSETGEKTVSSQETRMKSFSQSAFCAAFQSNGYPNGLQLTTDIYLEKSYGF